MIPTKTYPLSAITGDDIDEYEKGYHAGMDEGRERIAELADAFNRVCAENADFVAQSVTDEARIAELQDSFEDAVTRAEQAENRIAELEAQVKHCEGHAAELESEVKTLRKSGIGLIGILEEILYAISIDKNCSERTRTAAATLEQRIKAAREGK